MQNNCNNYNFKSSKMEQSTSTVPKFSKSISKHSISTTEIYSNKISGYKEILPPNKILTFKLLIHQPKLQAFQFFQSSSKRTHNVNFENNVLFMKTPIPRMRLKFFIWTQKVIIITKAY